MRIIGNFVWLIFGGLEAAICYFSGALALAITIVGLPWAWQIFKLGVLCLWPFGAEVKDCKSSTAGCLYLPLNILWFIFGGIMACIMHFLFGVLLCITIVGIPFGRQHFKMIPLVCAPFGKDVQLKF